MLAQGAGGADGAKADDRGVGGLEGGAVLDSELGKALGKAGQAELGDGRGKVAVEGSEDIIDRGELVDEAERGQITDAFGEDCANEAFGGGDDGIAFVRAGGLGDGGVAKGAQGAIDEDIDAPGFGEALGGGGRGDGVAALEIASVVIVGEGFGEVSFEGREGVGGGLREGVELAEGEEAAAGGEGVEGDDGGEGGVHGEVPFEE